MVLLLLAVPGAHLSLHTIPSDDSLSKGDMQLDLPAGDSVHCHYAGQIASLTATMVKVQSMQRCRLIHTSLEQCRHCLLRSMGRSQCHN